MSSCGALMLMLRPDGTVKIRFVGHDEDEVDATMRWAKNDPVISAIVDTLIALRERTEAQR